MRRLVLVSLFVLGCGPSSPPPAAPPSAAPPAAAAKPDAGIQPGSYADPNRPRGVQEHQCYLEAKGFECSGCQVRATSTDPAVLANPTCQVVRDGKPLQCPRRCCGLCPKE